MPDPKDDLEPLLPKEEDQEPKLSEEEQKKRAQEMLQKRIADSFAKIPVDKERKAHYEAIKALAAKENSEEELKKYFEKDEVKKINDHAFLRFQRTVLATLDVKIDKAADGTAPQPEKDKDGKAVKRSNFLGVIMKEFSFLGEDIPADKAKDVGNLTKTLQSLSKNNIGKELGLETFLKGQFEDYKKDTTEDLGEAIAQGMTDVESAKFTLAKDALMKTAQIAAIGALAATGGIIPAAILAGALFWWHSRKNAKKTSSEKTAEEKKAEEEKELAAFRKREKGIYDKDENEMPDPDSPDFEEALRKAAEEQGVPPKELEDALEIAGGGGNRDGQKPNNPAKPTKPTQPSQPTGDTPSTPSKPKSQEELDALHASNQAILEEAEKKRLAEAKLKLEEASRVKDKNKDKENQPPTPPKTPADDKTKPNPPETPKNPEPKPTRKVTWAQEVDDKEKAKQERKATGEPETPVR